MKNPFLVHVVQGQANLGAASPQHQLVLQPQPASPAGLRHGCDFISRNGAVTRLDESEHDLVFLEEPSFAVL